MHVKTVNHMEVNREQLAWAAGLFEGEGCITFWTAKDTGNVYIQCVLGTTDRDVLENFQSIIGFGNIHAEKFDERYKQSWRWSVSSFEKCQAVIAMLWPWLGRRRKARALEVLTLFRNCGSRYTLPKERIVQLYNSGLSQSAISKMFGCTQAAISYIITLHKKKNS